MGNQNGWQQQMWPKLQKVIERGQNESTQRLILKNAKIESNKSDQIPRLLNEGRIDTACLLTQGFW